MSGRDNKRTGCNSPSITLRDVFPLFGSFTSEPAIDELLDLEIDRSTPAQQRSFIDVLDATGQSLGTLASGIQLPPPRDIIELDLSTRAFHCVRRASIDDTGALLGTTVRQLAGQRGVGRLTVTEIVWKLITHLGTATPLEDASSLPTPGTPRDHAETALESHAALVLSSWQRFLGLPDLTIARLQSLEAAGRLPPTGGLMGALRRVEGACLEPDETLGDFIAARGLAQFNPGADYPALDPSDTPGPETTTQRNVRLSALMRELLNEMERERPCRFFIERNIRRPAPTLDELGRRHSLTRERVRQLVHSGELQLRAWLHGRFAPIAWVCDDVRWQLGPVFPADAMHDDDRLVALGSGVEDPGAGSGLLIQFIMGIHQQEGWMGVSKAPFPNDRRTLEQLAGPHGVLGPPALVGSRLTSIGLRPTFVLEWLLACSSLRLIEGQYVLWPRSVVGRASAVLAVRGAPISIGELLDIAATGMNQRGARAQLIAGLPRPSPDTLGLHEWVTDDPGSA